MIYQIAGGATLEVLRHMLGGIVVRMNSRRGDKARLMFNGRRNKRKTVELYLTDQGRVTMLELSEMAL